MTADDPRRPVPSPPLHPDLDTLADHDAGVLDPAVDRRVADHLRTCAQCTGAMRAMATVQADLRSLPTPPMPAAVAARLEDLLADLRRGELPGSPDRRPSDPGPPDRRAPVPIRTDQGRPAPERGPVRPPAGDAPVPDLAAARKRRRTRMTRIAGGIAAAVAVLAAAGSVTALVRAGSSSSSDDAGTAASGPGGSEQAPAATGPGLDDLGVPSYSKESLRSALPQIEQQSAVSVITGRGDTGPAGAMSDTARRTACAGTIRGSSGQLQAVRRIMYEGRMAYVFVFSEGGERVAYVVSDDCGISPALPAAVLDKVS